EGGVAGGRGGASALGPAGGAAAPPGGVHQEHPQGPQRHELEAPLRQAVVTRALATAARADRPAVGTGMHRHFQVRASRAGKAHGAVDKRLMPLDTSEDRLELPPGPPSGLDGSFPNSSISGDGSGCTFFSSRPAAQRRTPHATRPLRTPFSSSGGNGGRNSFKPPTNSGEDPNFLMRASNSCS